MRLRFLLMAALAAGGCKDKNEDDGPSVNFSDDFSAGFPGSGWTIASAAGSGSIDMAAGNPAPSLVMQSVPPGSYTIRSNATYFTNSSIVSVAVRHDGGPGFFYIEVAKPGVGTFAAALIGETGVSFSVPGANIGVASDTAWHTFVFRSDYIDTAQWLMDGVVRQSTSSFPGPLGNHSGVTLDLRATGGCTAHVDNVSIIVPYP